MTINNKYEIKKMDNGKDLYEVIDIANSRTCMVMVPFATAWSLVIGRLWTKKAVA